MSSLSYDLLTAACSAGGPSVLTAVTELKPAAGEHAGIAPARYSKKGSKAGLYAFETRFIDGEPQHVVVVDSKASQLNRVEDALALALSEGEDEALKKMPRISVKYEGFEKHDFELPHRFSDAHIRFGTAENKPVTEHPKYVAARNSTPANAMDLIDFSPISIVLGSWDSTRKAHQARYRSCLVGEIIGVLTDQTPEGLKPSNRGAARKDDLAPSVQLDGKEILALLETQEAYMSPKKVEEIKKEAKGAKAPVSASKLGLGAIPPSLDSLGLVSCRRIIRSHVLSFAALRQLRFGLDKDGNVAGRALLAALALHGLVLANEELYLRANCDLVEADAPVFTIDRRHGNQEVLDAPTRVLTEAVLKEAIEAAKQHGITWDGQVFAVEGNPVIMSGVSESEDEE